MQREALWFIHRGAWMNQRSFPEMLLRLHLCLWNSSSPLSLTPMPFFPMIKQILVYIWLFALLTCKNIYAMISYECKTLSHVHCTRGPLSASTFSHNLSQLGVNSPLPIPYHMYPSQPICFGEIWLRRSSGSACELCPTAHTGYWE